MDNVKLITVLISCPGDIQEEIDTISLVFSDINKTMGKEKGYRLEPIYWHSDTYPSMGSEPQEPINEQFKDKYDVILSIFWKRIGSPTKKYASGTVEEISKAIALHLEGKLAAPMIYFKTGAPKSLKDLDLDQLAKLEKYKKELFEQGVGYKEYDTIQNFERGVRINFMQMIKDNFLNSVSEIVEIVKEVKEAEEAVTVAKVQTVEVIKESQDKYQEISNILADIENSPEPDDIDFLELQVETTSSLDFMTQSLERIANLMNGFSDDTNASTKKITAISVIRDTRLKTKRLKQVLNLMAGNLNVFNTHIAIETPMLSEHMNRALEGYASIQLNFKMSLTDENDKTTLELRDSLESAAHSCAIMLKTIHEIPPMNHQFNEAKRETVSEIKELASVLLNGLKMINEISSEITSN